jgi:hypothetical protein
MEDSTKKTLMAVGVGVGATGVIATAMYFLGGREAPKMPTMTGFGNLTKREIGFGALVETRIRKLSDRRLPLDSSQTIHSPIGVITFGDETEPLMEVKVRMNGTQETKQLRPVRLDDGDHSNIRTEVKRWIRDNYDIITNFWAGSGLSIPKGWPFDRDIAFVADLGD